LAYISKRDIGRAASGGGQMTRAWHLWQRLLSIWAVSIGGFFLVAGGNAGDGGDGGQAE